MLAFTRRQVLEPVVLDPAQVIADLVPMLQPMLGKDIDLVVDVEPGSGWVRVDPVQLEQVIVNLAVNARDAMEDGGTLTIAVHNLKPTDVDKPDATAAKGSFVRIKVTDTGTGMDERHDLADLRSVLHDEARRQGHRARARHGVRDRGPVRRDRSTSTALLARARHSRSIFHA